VKKTTLTVALVAALVLAVPTILAQDMRGHGDRPGFGPHDGMDMHRMLSRLDLDDAQRDAIHALFGDFRPRIEEAQGVVEELGAELHGLAQESGYDEALLRPIAETRGAAMAEMTLLKIEMHSSVRELLTPEQIETLEALHGRKGHGGRPGPGGRASGHGPGNDCSHGPGNDCSHGPGNDCSHGPGNDCSHGPDEGSGQHRCQGGGN